MTDPVVSVLVAGGAALGIEVWPVCSIDRRTNRPIPRRARRATALREAGVAEAGTGFSLRSLHRNAAGRNASHNLVVAMLRTSNNRPAIRTKGRPRDGGLDLVRVST